MTKVISLSDHAYQTMKSLKEEGESFSDVVLKLSSRRRHRPISDFFGSWAGSDDEAKEIKKTLAEERRIFRLRGDRHVLP